MAPAPRPFRRAATTAHGGGGGRSREGAGGERARPQLDALSPPAAVARMVRPGRRVPLPGAAVPPWPQRGRYGRWVRTAPAPALPSRTGLCCPGRAARAPRGVPQHPRLSLSTPGCPSAEAVLLRGWGSAGVRPCLRGAAGPCGAGLGPRTLRVLTPRKCLINANAVLMRAAVVSSRAARWFCLS